MIRKTLLTLVSMMAMLPALVTADSLIGVNKNIAGFVVISSESDGQKLVDSQVSAKGQADSLERTHGVSLVEEFLSGESRYQVLGAANEASVKAYLDALGTTPLKISSVDFTNSPVLGGGPQAGATPKDGHKVYMIEREVPGIGGLPFAKMTEISKGSQGVIESLNGNVEWDKSYLTQEGTFCAYRATDASQVRKHAEIAGFPANKVTEVTHVVYNHNFTGPVN